MIRLTGHVDQATVRNNPPRVSSSGTVLAYADTEAEAEQAKRAFELVLAPRFTRDEAIAIVRQALSAEEHTAEPATRGQLWGIRLALEALAAAGVFSDCTHAGSPASSLCALDMAGKLDAAGIR